MSRYRSKDCQWWLAEDEPEIAKKVVSAYENAERHSAGRRADDQFHLALYGGGQDISGAGYKRSDDGQRIRFNVIQSIGDTLQAEIAQVQPRPRFLTSHGDWSLRRRAEAMQWAVEGELERNDVFAQSEQLARTSIKLGTGAFYVYPHDGMPRIERTYPCELVVDPVDAYYGQPRNLYRVRLVDREELRAYYGGESEGVDAAIDSASSASYRDFPFLPRSADHDMVRLVQAWHLPCQEDGSDGRYYAVIDGAVLNPEDTRVWDRDCFPFAIYRLYERDFGFWGIGVSEQLVGLQTELNYTLRKIQDIIHNVSTVRYLQRGNADLRVEPLTNMPGEIVRFSGDVPVVQVVNGVPPELFNHAQQLIDRAYQQVGVSQMSAAAKKPAGLNSGAALREHEDIESRRFICVVRNYERMFCDLAKLIVEEKRAIAKRGDEKPVQVAVQRSRRTALKTIKWKEADLEADEYRLQVMPSSNLPRTPAGRTAAVEQWQQAGWISRQQAMVLLDMPDLDDFLQTELAPYFIVLDSIEEIIEDGTYVPPEPAQDLALSIKLVQSSILRYRIEGVPDETLDLLYRYIDDCAQLEQLAAAPTPPAGATNLPAMDPMAALPSPTPPTAFPPGP